MLKPIFVGALLFAIAVAIFVAFQTKKISAYDTGYLMIKEGDPIDVVEQVMGGRGDYSSEADKTGVWGPVLNGHKIHNVRATCKYKVFSMPESVVWEIDMDKDYRVVHKVRTE